MFLFLRLLLAHLIGDFPLQFSAVYSLKVKGTSGKLIHVAIVTATMILLSWPFWNSSYFWLIILFNAAGHYIQDWIKLSALKKMKNKNDFFVFLIDQILHVASLCVIWLTPLAQQSPEYHGNSFILKTYFDTHTILVLIGLVTASFSGTFILATFKDTFLPDKFPTPYLDPAERLYDVLERSVMFLLLLKSLLWLSILPLFLFPKILFSNFQIKQLKGNTIISFLMDTCLGIVWCAISYGIYKFLL